MAVHGQRRQRGNGCHALAIDERRCPFAEYRIEAEAVAASEGRLQELWFAGVHGDIGGQNRDDDRLPDIAFSWMVKEALTEGLAVNAKRYRHLVGVNFDDDLPADRALGVILPNNRWWWLTGGWHLRPIQPDDELHPSVRYQPPTGHTPSRRRMCIPPSRVRPVAQWWTAVAETSC